MDGKARFVDGADVDNHIMVRSMAYEFSSPLIIADRNNGGRSKSDVCVKILTAIEDYSTPRPGFEPTYMMPSFHHSAD